jgi:hypothetical protein
MRTSAQLLERQVGVQEPGLEKISVEPAIQQMADVEFILATGTIGITHDIERAVVAQQVVPLGPGSQTPSGIGRSSAPRARGLHFAFTLGYGGRHFHEASPVAFW